MNLNLTNVVITLVFFVIGWLFIPSPLHDCPEVKPVTVIDTLWLVPDNIDSLDLFVITDDEMIPVNYEHIILEQGSVSYEIDLLTFQKVTERTIPEETVPIMQGLDTLGTITLGKTTSIFRSTTFYEIGDSLAQTIHEIAINPRPVTTTMRPREIKFEMKPIVLPPKPISILESPVTWGLIGIVAGGLVVLIIINNDKENDNAN